MNAHQARVKARRSERFAHSAALVTLVFGICGAWGLATGHPVLNPIQGLIGAVAGILAGAAYRAAGRWERLADSAGAD